jgi:hypothetical protein
MFLMDSTSTPSLIHAGSSETNADRSHCYSPTNKESWESLGFATVQEIEKFYVIMHITLDFPLGLS